MGNFRGMTIQYRLKKFIIVVRIRNRSQRRKIALLEISNELILLVLSFKL
ncbi:hypothetical protein DJ90_6559 [Paenibacillus macerans]|uniref:Uncharacterized protein n=1 Tax=Paenibacillus macerans TaxID=44252 RepID=A0A090ZMT8_PAEMA|nr:hypothetical protein DJ90_6559 [Paenibacillus macerans]